MLAGLGFLNRVNDIGCALLSRCHFHLRSEKVQEKKSSHSASALINRNVVVSRESHLEDRSPRRRCETRAQCSGQVRIHLSQLFQCFAGDRLDLFLDIISDNFEICLFGLQRFFDRCFHWILSLGILVGAWTIGFEQSEARQMKLELIPELLTGLRV